MRRRHGAGGRKKKFVPQDFTSDPAARAARAAIRRRALKRARINASRRHRRRRRRRTRSMRDFEGRWDSQTDEPIASRSRTKIRLEEGRSAGDRKLVALRRNFETVQAEQAGKQ